ncbi:hypothetical protein NCCP436_14550 [Pseudomonas sp. NCCP-436]|nr:hypothetical protein NCCP436_14550 [Pseudomonas sp. NCCP-436]
MRIVDLFRLLLLAAIWGASFLFMRVAAPVLGSMPTAFFRTCVGALSLLAVLLALRSDWEFRGKFRICMLLGVINAGLPSAMYCLAALILPAGYSAIFNATTPLMGVLIGATFFHEGITPGKALGVALGLSGIAALTRTGPVAFDLPLLFGAAGGLVATTCYGFAGFLTRRWIGQQGGLDNRLTAFASLLGASLFLLPLFIASLACPPRRLGRNRGLAVAGRSRPALHRLRLCAVLPSARRHRSDQGQYHDFSDPAVRRVLRRSAAGRATELGLPARKRADRHCPVAGGAPRGR